MIDRHLMKLRARDDISSEEEQAIRAAVSEERDYRSDFTFIRRGKGLDHSTLLLDGLMGRYRDLRHGERQITHIHVPGDFADLHTFTLRHLDQNVMTLTPCRVGIVPHDRLRKITEDHPRLARLYWFATNVDGAIHREWEVSLGRRLAASRIAHLFCELQLRLSAVGLAAECNYDLDLTQTDLADCLGLTPVHINRKLKDLRERGLVSFRGGHVEIRDLPSLQRLADFDPMYLYLDRRTRR